MLDLCPGYFVIVPVPCISPFGERATIRADSGGEFAGSFGEWCEVERVYIRRDKRDTADTVCMASAATNPSSGPVIDASPRRLFFSRDPLHMTPSNKPLVWDCEHNEERRRSSTALLQDLTRARITSRSAALY